MGAPIEKKDGFAVATPSLLRNSLQRRLVPVADRLRDLNTRFGMRPYRVRVVRTNWTSGRRGVGPEVVTHELEILPTPLVVDLGTVAEEVTAVGPTEIGATQIREISGRYTEDHLTGVDAQGNPPGEADSVYFEVESFRPDGQPAERRRFAISSVPYYDPGKFEWQITLDAQIAKRQRDGSP